MLLHLDQFNLDVLKYANTGINFYFLPQSLFFVSTSLHLHLLKHPLFSAFTWFPM